jgi:hypothetical protein
MVERAERPQGPEQELKALFRDSNTNADDIMKEKRREKVKAKNRMEVFVGGYCGVCRSDASNDWTEDSL